MQVPLVEDDKVVQAFSPDRANHSFGKGILPWRPWCNENLFDGHFLNSLLEEIAIDAITITNQILRHSVIWEGLSNLLCRPASSGMHGDIEMNNSSSMMSKDDEAIQYLEPDCRYCEEIDRSDVFGMVLQKRSPRLGRRFLVLNHVFCHSGVCYLMPKQFQF